MEKFISKNNMIEIYKRIKAEFSKIFQSKLPEGEVGQVLTKTENGLAWGDASSQDMSDYVVKKGNQTIEGQTTFKNNIAAPIVIEGNNEYSLQINSNNLNMTSKVGCKIPTNGDTGFFRGMHFAKGKIYITLESENDDVETIFGLEIDPTDKDLKYYNYAYYGGDGVTWANQKHSLLHEGNLTLYLADSSKSGIMSKEYATKLESISTEWVGTKSEYDALGTYDNNTIYYITEEE